MGDGAGSPLGAAAALKTKSPLQLCRCLARDGRCNILPRKVVSSCLRSDGETWEMQVISLISYQPCGLPETRGLGPAPEGTGWWLELVLLLSVLSVLQAAAHNY